MLLGTPSTHAILSLAWLLMMYHGPGFNDRKRNASNGVGMLNLTSWISHLVCRAVAAPLVLCVGDNPRPLNVNLRCVLSLPSDCSGSELWLQESPIVQMKLEFTLCMSQLNDPEGHIHWSVATMHERMPMLVSGSIYLMSTGNGQNRNQSNSLGSKASEQHKLYS